MTDKKELIQLVTAIGNYSRYSMLELLMSGRYFTAKELAYGAGLQPSAATAHLKTLVDSRLVTTFHQGRCKYFTLFSPEVASVIESMMCLTHERKIRRKLPDPDMCTARVCFNHIAGRLGVYIYSRMHELNYLVSNDGTREMTITETGYSWLQQHNFDCSELRDACKKQALQCMDWSERTPHTGGILGRLIADYFIAEKMVARKRNSRSVTLTAEGRVGIRRLFGNDVNFSLIEGK